MGDSEKRSLIAAIKAGIEWINNNAKKTAAFYEKTLTSAVRGFYNGLMDYSDFTSILENLVVGQLRRAWYEGMEANGLTPDDMIPEWAAMLREIIQSEQDHVPDFALAIEKARRDQSGLDPLLSRAQLWVNRYNDVVNQAKMATAAVGQKLIWVYGDTDHCDTCLSLNGLVAFAVEWDASGYHPQRPPNEMLDCQGWRCQCMLMPTDKSRNENIREILGLSEPVRVPVSPITPEPPGVANAAGLFLITYFGTRIIIDRVQYEKLNAEARKELVERSILQGFIKDKILTNQNEVDNAARALGVPSYMLEAAMLFALMAYLNNEKKPPEYTEEQWSKMMAWAIYALAYLGLTRQKVNDMAEQTERQMK